MVLTGIGVLCYLFSYLAVKTKRLTAFEALAVGLFIAFLCIEYASILLNLKRLDFPRNAPLMTTAQILSQIALFPITSGFIINVFLKREECGNRVVSIAAGGLWLALLEYTGDWAGILKHQNWNFLYSFLIWSVVLFLTTAFLKWIRILTKNELKLS